MKLRRFTVFSIFLVFVIMFNIKAQPTAPANLTATQQTWQKFVYVKLDWQGAKSGFMNQTKYNVYRKNLSDNDTNKFERIYSRVPMTTWIDKFVQKGDTYSYYVTAVQRQAESSPSDTVTVSLDSALSKAVVTGKLISSKDGSSIANGKISFIPVFGWGMTNVRTDSTGSYSVSLFPGSYLISASAGGYFSQYYNNVRDIRQAEKITLNSGDSTGINISLSPKAPPQTFTMTGSVKDSSGNPLRSLIVIYNIAFNSYSHRFYHAMTDSSGNFSVKVSGGDTLVVYAKPIDHNYYSEYYNNKYSFLDADRIAVTQNVQGINMVLEHKPAYSNGISGTVQDSSGQGVEAIVHAIRLGNFNDHLYHRKYSTVTDSTGEYSFSNLIPGSYILMALPQDGYKPTFFKYDGSQTLRWKDADSVTVDSNGIDSGINFTVLTSPDSGAAEVNGSVTDNSGAPVNGAIVYATDDNQQVYSYGVSDQNGNYTISGLVPGNYSVTTELFGYDAGQTSSVTLDYSANFSTDASFTVTPQAVTSVPKEVSTVKGFQLNQNYPNPFNPTTVINFEVPTQTRVTLKVFNILGSEVATLVNSVKAPGSYNVIFDGSHLASGVYIYQLKAGEYIATRKLVLLK